MVVPLGAEAQLDCKPLGDTDKRRDRSAPPSDWRDETRGRQDDVALIFWYKDDNPVPIYTLDARADKMKHYAASARYRLDPVAGLSLARLRVANAETRDSGRYKCRVDFQHAPTISRQQVRLLVEGE